MCMQKRRKKTKVFSLIALLQLIQTLPHVFSFLDSHFSSLNSRELKAIFIEVPDVIFFMETHKNFVEMNKFRGICGLNNMFLIDCNGLGHKKVGGFVYFGLIQ